VTSRPAPHYAITINTRGNCHRLKDKIEAGLIRTEKSAVAEGPTPVEFSKPRVVDATHHGLAMEVQRGKVKVIKGERDRQ
jgi:hypothetical protein